VIVMSTLVDPAEWLGIAIDVCDESTLDVAHALLAASDDDGTADLIDVMMEFRDCQPDDAEVHVPSVVRAGLAVLEAQRFALLFTDGEIIALTTPPDFVVVGGHQNIPQEA
jgi:hypothetical protein